MQSVQSSRSRVVVHLCLLAGLLAPVACDSKEETPGSESAESSSVRIEVGAMGYAPSEVEAAVGKPLTLAFERTTEEGCGEKLVFPDHGIEKDLPVGEVVEVTITPTSEEKIAFTCGMGMYKGSIVAQ